MVLCLGKIVSCILFSAISENLDIILKLMPKEGITKPGITVKNISVLSVFQLERINFSTACEILCKKLSFLGRLEISVLIF